MPTEERCGECDGPPRPGQIPTRYECGECGSVVYMDAPTPRATWASDDLRIEMEAIRERGWAMERVMQRIADAAGFEGKPGDVSGLLDHIRSLNQETD